jgi:hypothetical protein
MAAAAPFVRRRARAHAAAATGRGRVLCVTAAAIPLPSSAVQNFTLSFRHAHKSNSLQSAKPRIPLPNRAGARVEDATEHSSTAGKADAGARRAGFAVPPPGPDSSDAPSPGAAAAMGPGAGMMGGADDLVSGSARGDKARAAEGMDEMTHGAAPGELRAGPGGGPGGLGRMNDAGIGRACY